MTAFALPKSDDGGMWSGITKCSNAACKAMGPIVSAPNKEEAIEQANAAALRRYEPPFEPLTLEDALRRELCFIELKSAALDNTSKLSAYGRVEYNDDETKACIWRLDAGAPLYAALAYYEKTWRCRTRRPTPEESTAVEWRELACD